MWQRFFVLTLWEVFRPPQLSWTSVDLPIFKYKNIIFILPFRLMVRMLQVATEPRGLCKPGIPFCLRPVGNPVVRSCQCHGCILQLFLSREGWQRGCSSWLCTSKTSPGCPHHIQPVQTTQPGCSSPGPGLGLPTQTPQPQSQGHKLSHIHGPANIGVAPSPLIPLPRPGPSYPGYESPLLDAIVAQSLLARFTCTPPGLNSGSHRPAVPSRLLPLTLVAP